MNSLNGSIHLPSSGREVEKKFQARPFVSPDPLPQAADPSGIGSDLTLSDYAELEARWIDRSLAAEAGLRRVDSLTGGEIVGRKSGNNAGIVIPYSHPGSDQVREYRLRRDHPDLEYDSAGNLRPRQKYLSPPGRSNMLYLVPGMNPKLLQDLSIPIVVTEGEFKTLALWRLAEHGSPGQPRLLPLGLSGVYNWRGIIGKTVGPDGSRLDVKGVIPDLDWVGWQGRKVVIAYDADVVTKELVRAARSELAAPPVLSSLPTCAAEARWSVSSNGISQRARASTTIWRLSGPTP